MMRARISDPDMCPHLGGQFEHTLLDDFDTQAVGEALALVPDKICDVVDRADPGLVEGLQYAAFEADLDRSAGVTRSVGAVVGIPLEPDFAAVQHGSPLGMFHTRRRGAGHRLQQQGAKALEVDLDGQNAGLPLLGRPSAAVHHPQKIGLDPGHAPEREGRTSKALVGHGPVGDFGTVGLVDHQIGAAPATDDVLADLGKGVFVLGVRYGGEVHGMNT